MASSRVSGPAPIRKFWGLATREDRWGLSKRGWLVLATLLLVGCIGTIFGAHPFLAISKPLNTRVLVVEGWVHDFAIDSAIRESTNGHYSLVIATGGPVMGTAANYSVYDTSAHVGASRLIRGGIPKDKVVMVPSKRWSRDRTYWAAVALRNWLAENQPGISAINVLTEGVHARRTRLLYERALGSSINIGIIAVSNPEYQAQAWWKSSEGFREVVGEMIAYIYARILFIPGDRIN